MTVVASGYERSPNDLYDTEDWATEAMLRHVDIAGLLVWEPAAGRNAMAKVLRQGRARDVLTSDIADYDGFAHDARIDFLGVLPDDAPRVDAIVTNPPYGRQNRTAVAFCERALALCDGVVAMLLTAKFDSGSTRTHLLRDNPRFRAKIVLIDRIMWFPGDNQGTEDHAWFVWGPATPFAPPPRLIYEGKPR